MIYIYKDDQVCQCTPDQLEIMEAAGWSSTLPQVSPPKPASVAKPAPAKAAEKE